MTHAQRQSIRTGWPIQMAHPPVPAAPTATASARGRTVTLDASGTGLHGLRDAMALNYDDPAQALMDLVCLACETARDLDVDPVVFHQMIRCAKIDTGYGGLSLATPPAAPAAPLPSAVAAVPFKSVRTS